MPRNKPTRSDAATDPRPRRFRRFEPLKPRKGLFALLCVVFAVWVGLLTTLYFKTVYGKEDPHAHRVVDQPPEKGP